MRKTIQQLYKLPEYFHVLLKVACLIVLGFFLETTFKLGGRGISSVYLLIELLACLFLVKKYKEINLTGKQYWFFLLFHILIFLADLGYAVIYYFLGYARPTAAHTVYLCITFGLSFLALAGFFIYSFEKGALKKYLKSAYIIIPMIIIVVAALSLSSSLWINSAKLGWSFVLFEAFVLVCSYILFFFSSLSYMSATDYFWNLVSSGSIIMLAGDWTMKMRKFRGLDVVLIPEDYLWGIGVFTLCICVFGVNKGSKKLSFLDGNLYSTKTKVVSFALSIVLFTIQNFLFWGDENVIRNLTWCLIFTLIANAAYDNIEVVRELTRRGKLIANQEARLELAAASSHVVGTSVDNLKDMIETEIKPKNAALYRIFLSQLEAIKEFSEETFRDRWLRRNGKFENVQMFQVMPNSLSDEIKGYKTRLFEKKNFSIEVDCDEDRKFYNFSPKIMFGLLDNCIRNAQIEKATKVTIQKRDNIINIIDNGNGFDQKTAVAVFNAGSSISTHNGHGEGLSLSKKWLNEWGGDIWVSSLSDPTTISIKLLESEKIKKVVLIDDQAFYREIWYKSAKRYGIEFISCSSIEEFNSGLARGLFDASWVICVDDCLGEKSGRVEMVKLKKKFKYVFLTTAVPQDLNDIECLGKRPIWEEKQWC